MSGLPSLDVIQFTLADEPWALPIDRVIEVGPRVRVVPCPGLTAPAVGVVRYRGALVTCVDLRLRVGLKARPASLDDHLILAEARGRTLALVVDRVDDVKRITPEHLHRRPPRHEHIDGIAWLAEGLHLIFDLDLTLPLESLCTWSAAVAGFEGGAVTP